MCNFLIDFYSWKKVQIFYLGCLKLQYIPNEILKNKSLCIMCCYNIWLAYILTMDCNFLHRKEACFDFSNGADRTGIYFLLLLWLICFYDLQILAGLHNGLKYFQKENSYKNKLFLVGLHNGVKLFLKEHSHFSTSIVKLAELKQHLKIVKSVFSKSSNMLSEKSSKTSPKFVQNLSKL